jgi:hypothetical protein
MCRAPARFPTAAGFQPSVFIPPKNFSPIEIKLALRAYRLTSASWYLRQRHASTISSAR